MRTFVDTNIVLGAHDRREPEKSTIARAILSDLWRTREGLLSTQILQELYVSGAERILSEDCQHGRTIAGVRIENPFRR